MKRMIVCLTALGLIACLLFLRPQAPSGSLPGVPDSSRELLRIWTISSIGGGQAWLKAVLKQFEKSHPGVMTYLRTVPADELVREDAVLPDLVLYLPGDLTDPSMFAPLSGVLAADEALLRCGRWRGQQFGLPLCWGGYVLTIDESLEPENAVTPAPTTLLGRPAETTDPAATPTPGYPLAAAATADEAIQAPAGASLFALGLTIPELPSLPESIGAMTPADVYRHYLAHRCASAMLTSGQLVALESLAGSGSASAFRTMVADTVVTDQVWLGSIVSGASPRAAELLGMLTGRDAQKLLAEQGLHPVQFSLRLYPGGVPLLLDRAASRSFTAINAFAPRQATEQAARLYLQGACSLDEALLPLI